MSETENKEDNLLNIQIFVLILSLVSIIISIIITYNQKLKIEKKETIFEDKNDKYVSIFNRVLILIIALLFLYINYQFYKLNKKKNNNCKNEKLQLNATFFTIIAALISLYVVYTSKTETLVDIEKPLT